MNAERLRELLHYDPETGVFTWRVKASRNTIVGSVAGSLRKKYLVIGLDNRTYTASRLAWLYMTGKWPEHEVDHEDQNKANNRWLNLRDVPHRLNTQNQRRAHRDSTSRFLGVAPSGRRWRAYISTGNAKQTHLGCFETKEQAHAAYLAAKAKLHEGFIP